MKLWESECLSCTKIFLTLMFFWPSKVGGLSASVLVGDTTSIQALNLDPGCPQVTEDVYRYVI